MKSNNPKIIEFELWITVNNKIYNDLILIEYLKIKIKK